uniref:1-alkyl-2-acetylglycerophosphocholine esterase n=1 Tax=Alexandrium catenella TaxID=2925 RepID=A0A7S1WKQ7_ALECA
MVFSRIALLVAAATASAVPIVLEPAGSKQGDLKLLLLVPGGKVPPEDYLPMAKGAQEKSTLRLAVGIPRCHINLCDAIFELPGLLKDLVASVNKTAGGALRTADVFVSGHSLGGTGARHFYDIWPGSAGLALFGTQYNGDHEDYMGTLGYPMDLKAFAGAFLALTGELDMLPISHTAELVRQWEALPGSDFHFEKLPIIVPGMDHSQFCPPFQVSGDIVPEISDDAAVTAVSEILAAWLDAVVSQGSDAAALKLLEGYALKTAPIAAPFIEATRLDEVWCSQAQGMMARSLEGLKVSVEHRFDSASLEHCHPSAVKDGSSLKVTACDYRFYSYLNSSVPNFIPTYEGAKDISCKMVSEDKIAAELGRGEVDMSSDEVMNKCAMLNRKAYDAAMGLVTSGWPKAAERFAAQGKTVTFKDDSQSFMGPQWVLTGLGFRETDAAVEIQSEALLSPVTSRIYPGNHYCKLLAPSKAVELIMTRGLTKRYSGAGAQQKQPAAPLMI